MRKVNWDGVYPAVLTMFNEDGSLDITTYIKNIKFQVESGVNGIIIGGSLGESSTLTHADRLRLLEVSLSEVGNQVDIIMNIAEGSTANAVKLAKDAEAAGAHGLMVLPPMMYKPTDAEVVHFFKTIAKATNLPILVYNNPVDYKINITIDMFRQMSDHANINAVKESTRDTTNVIRMRNAFGDRFKILCGVDTLAYEALCLGADGWVAGLVDAFPAETVAIYKLTKAGRHQEALDIYSWFMPLLELDIHPQLVQNIKLAAVATGIGTDIYRAPRQPLEGAERVRVLKVIEEGLKKRPTLPRL